MDGWNFGRVFGIIFSFAGLLGVLYGGYVLVSGAPPVVVPADMPNWVTHASGFVIMLISGGITLAYIVLFASGGPEHGV